ncbi:MAG: hypothetical protein ACK4FW_03240 [Stenotrophomonas sp.]
MRDVREHFVDRIANPLTGAFVLSWCLWNYRFLMIVLSGEHVVRKIHLIKVMVYPEPWRIIVFGCVLPLATALAYLFLYPRPARFVYRHALKQKKLTLEERRRVEDETVLTVGDSQRLRARFAELQLSHRAKRSELDSEIQGLTEQVELLTQKYDQSERERLEGGATSGDPGELTPELEELFDLQHELAIVSAQNSELKERLEELGAELQSSSDNSTDDEDSPQIVARDPRSFDLLQFLGHSHRVVYPKMVQEEMDVTFPLAKYLLKQLIRDGMAEEVYEEDSGGVAGVMISDAGVETLLANKLL